MKEPCSREEGAHPGDSMSSCWWVVDWSSWLCDPIHQPSKESREAENGQGVWTACGGETREGTCALSTGYDFWIGH